MMHMITITVVIAANSKRPCFEKNRFINSPFFQGEKLKQLHTKLCQHTGKSQQGKTHHIEEIAVDLLHQ